MELIEKLLNQPKSRKVAVILALLATILPIPIAGLHKFYLGQPLWGIIYLLLWSTPIARIASAIDAVWYFVQDSEQFNSQFNGQTSSNFPIETLQMGAIAEALRELDKLREDGLVSEYEFEQKRRQLLDRIA
jgi:TM2 domain-containing membrane protein YozV